MKPFYIPKPSVEASNWWPVFSMGGAAGLSWFLFPPLGGVLTVILCKRYFPQIKQFFNQTQALPTVARLTIQPAPAKSIVRPAMVAVPALVAGGMKVAPLPAQNPALAG
jgi:hypothetical protein